MKRIYSLEENLNFTRDNTIRRYVGFSGVRCSKRDEAHTRVAAELCATCVSFLWPVSFTAAIADIGQAGGLASA